MLNSAYIDLNILRQNVKNIKNNLDNKTKFCAVVKADAYGHGASKIANAIYKETDCFAVALLEEAKELRLSGIDKDILILTPICYKDVSLAVYYNFILSVDNFSTLKMIENECAKQNRTIRIHLKFNTGMNRLGVDTLSELKEIAEHVFMSKYLILDGMFSHLGNPENKKDTKTAQNKFLLANNLIKGYNNKAICHLSASGGYLQKVGGDMVRIGILLYGYKPFKSDLVSVKPIMKVYAPLIKKRVIKAGEGCLYGQKTALSTQTLSLIRCGYADGFMRRENSYLFNNRCMDISALKGAKNTKKGVLIMDNADLLAKEYNTISYEVLCACAKRAEKIYLQ